MRFYASSRYGEVVRPHFIDFWLLLVMPTGISRRCKIEKHETDGVACVALLPPLFRPRRRLHGRIELGWAPPGGRASVDGHIRSASWRGDIGGGPFLRRL